MGAVIFTAHYRPTLIATLRPLLLTLTDGLPLVFWFYVMVSLNYWTTDKRANRALLIAFLSYLPFHLFVFAVQEGRSDLHSLSHAFAGLAIFHVSYHVISTWQDDLVDARRRLRGIYLLVACTAVALYIFSEVSEIRFMRSEIGSLWGAIIMLTFSMAFGVFSFSTYQQAGLIDTGVGLFKPNYQDNKIDIPVHLIELNETLDRFIQNQGYTQPNLTIGRLADQLKSNQHRLRELINKVKGYRNFSTYLNDHRLPLACKRLSNESDTSITEIALELGFGSITSFNRVFKAKFKISPSEYRKAN